MRKRTALLLAALTMTAALSGCGKSQTESTTEASVSETAALAESSTEETTEPETTIEAFTEPTAEDITPEDVTVRVGSLKGPTSMGLVSLMDKSDRGEAGNQYDFTMVTAADELLGKIVSSDLDIALVPANVASILYTKTDGGIAVIDINTLGVLYVVASDDSIKSFADLKGKTLYLTGKGTTPEYATNYLLSANGLTPEDVTLEFKSEATEVAAILKEKPDAIGLLPQPFVTVACAQNEDLQIVLDCTAEWKSLQGADGSQLVTGVTIVRKDFQDEYPNAVTLFLREHIASTEFANTNLDQTAELIVAQGIIEKVPIAKMAIPYCNITCITGEEMKAALSGYLQVLADQDPASVGGQVPGDDFYFNP